MNRRVLFCIPALALSGCFGPFVAVVPPEQVAQQQAAVSAVKIYDESQLGRLRFDVIDMIEGNSCQNKSNQPPASRTAAIDQLKVMAAQRGADGITKIQCGDREGTSVRTNCWTLITCSAEAIKLIP